MNRHIVATSIALAAVVAAGACNRGEETTTTSPEVQTQTAQQTNMPVTINGCLKAGDAENTFVITSTQAGGSGQAATYQLVDAQKANTNLGEHVGSRVEVSGTVEGQQEIASRTTAEATGDARATGTTGTPTVQTRTEIEIRRLSVASIKPLGEKCEM